MANSELSRGGLVRKLTNTGRKLRFLFGQLIFISIILSIGYLVYIQQQQQLTIEQLVNNTDTIYKTMRSISTQPKAPSSQTVVTPSDLAALKTELTASFNAQSPQKSSPQRPPQWFALELDYAFRLAKMQAQYTHDFLASVRILEHTIHRLREQSDSRWEPLIQCVDTIRIQLKTQLNHRAMILIDKIQTLDKLLIEMPFVQAELAEPAKADKIKKAARSGSDTWQTAWSASLAKLEKIVVVRKHRSRVQIVAEPQQRVLIKQNLALLRQQLILTVLQHQAALYHQSLRDMRRLVADYADKTSAVTVQIERILNALDVINLNENDPIDFTPLFNCLNQVLHQQATPEKTEVTSDATQALRV